MSLLRESLLEALNRNAVKGEDALGVVLVGKQPRIKGWPRGERVGWAGVTSPQNAWAYTVKQVRKMLTVLDAAPSAGPIQGGTDA